VLPLNDLAPRLIDMCLEEAMTGRRTAE
jgi:hypothetical protein